RLVAAPAESVAGFDEMVSSTQRRYNMLGGKGGVGKTSCSASLADLTGGTLVPMEGPDSPLFALEINPEKAREEFRSATQKNGGTGVKDFMDGMGLGVLAGRLDDMHLGELKLGELLDAPPPGLDEAIAISKARWSCFFKFFVLDMIIQFLESQEHDMFTRIVFDTAPTGHTLRFLSLPDFLHASIGKMLKLKQKIASATSAIKFVFGQEETKSDSADKLELLRERMIKVRELFRNTDSTEFVIVTIPTVMAMSESSRLLASLKKENVPVKGLIVNQVLPASATDHLQVLRNEEEVIFPVEIIQDQMRALEMLQNDPELSSLTLIQAPLVDVEIRGVPALGFLGDIIWK
ncbi:Anion-transporting ATPase-like domain, partial [Dillenia turbinata]